MHIQMGRKKLNSRPHIRYEYQFQTEYIIKNTICSTMDGPRDCHTEWIKWDRERGILYDIAKNLFYKTEIGSQT